MATVSLENDQLAILVAQYTNDTVEIAKARLDGRLGTPFVRDRMRKFQADLRYALQGDSPLEIYAASVKLQSVMMFGAYSQTVDLNTPIELTEADNNLLLRFNNVGQVMRNQSLELVRKHLDDIPLPKGSECDLGQYGGYSHEVLFPITNMAIRLRNLIPFSSADVRANKRIAACFGLDREVGRMVDGYNLNSRSTIMIGMEHIIDTTDKLLKPETTLEKITQSVASIFA
ncbi:hypothetical protein HY385_02610 [Candidatus Daviesbacteria bacterium]|nr:hypothetical protein [Candidatus Daviesbacteria bacterium]